METDISLVWITLAVTGWIVCLILLQIFVFRTSRPRAVIALAGAVGAFIICYLGGTHHEASQRYVEAESLAKEEAHTRVGREGYEYIFEPKTQILIDKILPNRGKIIASILRVDYLPPWGDSSCGWVSGDICTWMKREILYYHDPVESIRHHALYASTAALLAGMGYVLLAGVLVPRQERTP